MSFEFYAPNYTSFDASDGEADKFFDLHDHLENLSITQDDEKENEEIAGEDSNCDRKGNLDVAHDFNEAKEGSQGSDRNEDDGNGDEIKSAPTSAPSENVSGICKKSTRKGNVLREVPINVQTADKKRKSDSQMCGQPTKFISLAERILLFERSTPPRFRASKPVHPQVATQVRKHVTVPLTPKLRTKNRTRPVNYMSREEREAEEAERMKTYKLEVHPMKEKILKVPQIQKQKKSPTVVEPFNLTEFRKKEAVGTKSPFVFTAKPVPSGLFERTLGLPEKQQLPLTQPQSPAIFKHTRKLQIQRVEEVYGSRKLVVEDVSNSGVNMSVKCQDTLSRTVLKPFSFEERDKMLQEKKQEKLQKVLEEEKNAREFHAKPLPQYIKRRVNESTVTDVSVCTVASSCDVENDSPWKFKARPATVVRKPPFVPKKPEPIPVKSANVVLNTDVRAQKRQEFEEHIKEKEKMYEQVSQMIQEKKAEKDAEEIAEMRRKAVHKAQPIKHYKPVAPPPHISLTKPSTPKFTTKNK